jgi:hypothetical protein
VRHRREDGDESDDGGGERRGRAGRRRCGADRAAPSDRHDRARRVPDAAEPQRRLDGELRHHRGGQAHADRDPQDERVRCGEPAVQIAPVPVEFRCSAGTYGRPIRVIIVSRTGEAGVGRSAPPRDWPSARRMLGEDIVRQDRVTIAGPALERYVRSLANGLARGELVRRHLLGPARCPASVTLTPGKHASCNVKLGGTSLGFDLRFDAGRGFIADANGTIVVVDAIADAVRRAYAHARSVERKTDGRHGPLRGRTGIHRAAR